MLVEASPKATVSTTHSKLRFYQSYLRSGLINGHNFTCYGLIHGLIVDGGERLATAAAQAPSMTIAGADGGGDGDSTVNVRTQEAVEVASATSFCLLHLLVAEATFIALVGADGGGDGDCAGP